MSDLLSNPGRICQFLRICRQNWIISKWCRMRQDCASLYLDPAWGGLRKDWCSYKPIPSEHCWTGRYLPGIPGYLEAYACDGIQIIRRINWKRHRRSERRTNWKTILEVSPFQSSAVWRWHRLPNPLRQGRSMELQWTWYRTISRAWKSRATRD